MKPWLRRAGSAGVATLLSSLLLIVAAASADARTEILWDKLGVPHVFADDTAGMFYGFGWALATLHGDMLLRNYGTARGRAAEYWGADMELQGVPQAFERQVVSSTDGLYVLAPY